MELLERLLQDGRIDKEAFDLLKAEFEELTDQIKSLEQTSMTFENQIKALEAQISQAKRQGNEELLKELEQTKRELLELKKESVLSKLLDQYDLISRDVVFMALKSLIEVGEDGLRLNGKPIAEGVAEFMDAHLELQKPKGETGSGAGFGGVTSGFRGSSFTQKILARGR